MEPPAWPPRAARRAATRWARWSADAGGAIDCFYYAWGETDAYLVVDMPSDEAMLGIALSVNKSGSDDDHHDAADSTPPRWRTRPRVPCRG